MWKLRGLSNQLEERAGRRQQQDDDPRWRPPDGEQEEAGEREREIRRRKNGARPDRTVEGSAKDAD